jgi:general secretion pathway protein G
MEVPTQRRRTAFSLLEMLIVVAIIALLAALVAPRLAGALGEGRVKTTRAQIEMLAAGVEQFNLHAGRYPTKEEGLAVLLTKPENVADDKWQGPYVEKDFIPKDGWGRDFVYDFDDRGRFVIRSLGADGRAGGDGDNADLDNRSA